jgi:pimeloyl-ACP methyl ester carboxylesterase
MAGMARHAFAFLDGLGIKTCDVLGFSLGGMVAQQMAVERPSVFRWMILVGTAPRGGADIMHLDKPRLAHALTLQGYAVLQALFFAPTDTSQKAARPSRISSCNAARIASRFLVRPLPALRWSRSVNGKPCPANALPV